MLRHLCYIKNPNFRVNEGQKNKMGEDLCHVRLKIVGCLNSSSLTCVPGECVSGGIREFRYGWGSGEAGRARRIYTLLQGAWS